MLVLNIQGTGTPPLHAPLAVKQSVQIAAKHGLKEEVDVVRILEGGNQTNDKGAGDVTQHLPFPPHALLCARGNDVSLGHGFERVRLFGGRVHLQCDEAETSLTEDAKSHKATSVNGGIQPRHGKT